MKTIHLPLISFITVLLLASCSNESDKNNQQPNSVQPQNSEQPLTIQAQVMSQNQPQQHVQNNEPSKVVMKYFKDSTGAKSYRMPFPSDWKVNPNYKENLMIKGPNGIEVIESPPMDFYYTEDLEKQKELKHLGLELSPYVSIEQMAPSFLETLLNESGLTEIKNYPLPAYRERLQKASDKLQLTEGKIEIFAKVFEFKGSANEDAIILIDQRKTTIENVDFWSVNMIILRTSKADFEKAKDTYLFALNHIEYKPKTI